MQYIIGDLDFFRNREKENYEERNKKIVDHWNETVTNDDEVIIIGNVGQCSFEEMKSIIQSLNGKKILIDSKNRYPKDLWQEMGVNTIYHLPLYQEFSNKFVATFPFYYSNGSPFNYGVEHDFRIDCIEGKDAVVDDVFNVTADTWDYYPVEFDEIGNIYKRFKEEE